ncbi:MAG: DUF3048 domain-containing protein [Thiobacillus sp.]
MSFRPSNKPRVTPPAPKPEVIKYYSPLTGSEVADQAATTKPVTALMIENSPNARPQSGLKNSGVIFEAIAEGGITRFLVIYQAEKPQVIGPVRSLRLYDVDWVAPFNASIGHVGGSAAALNEVRNGNYRDIDQFFNPNAYYRATNRFAPHNVYTSFSRLDALNKAKGYKTSNFTGFSRTDEKPVAKPNATRINVTISGPLYNNAYTYDSASNSYIRYQAGELHLDREDGKITPKVVIVMVVNESTIFEDGYREKIDTIGNGKAYIFQNGTVITGTWHKSSLKSQVTLTDTSGKDVSLVRGQTWITAVPGNRGGGVTWK